MSDCTGYGINQDVSLDVSGPVGNGDTANLTIWIADKSSPIESQNFDESKTVVVNDWGGENITVDVTSLLHVDGNYSFVGANCDLEARLTLTSSGTNGSGTMLLEFIFTNCVGGDSPGLAAQVFDNCGGAGPHIVSQMSTFYFQSSPS